MVDHTDDVRQVEIKDIEVDVAHVSRREVRECMREMKHGNNDPIPLRPIDNGKFAVLEPEQTARVLAARQLKWLTVLGAIVPPANQNSDQPSNGHRIA